MTNVSSNNDISGSLAIIVVSSEYAKEEIMSAIAGSELLKLKRNHNIPGLAAVASDSAM